MTVISLITATGPFSFSWNLCYILYFNNLRAPLRSFNRRSQTSNSNYDGQQIDECQLNNFRMYILYDTIKANISEVL